MGQGISLKSEMKNHDLNHDLIFFAHTIDCVCHSIRSMFRVLGVYNFATYLKILGISNQIRMRRVIVFLRLIALNLQSNKLSQFTTFIDLKNYI